MKYQGQNSLVADGIVGPKTWEKLLKPKPWNLDYFSNPHESSSKYLWLFDNGHGGIIDGVYQTAGKRSPKWEDGTQLFEGEFNEYGTPIYEHREYDCYRMVPNTGTFLKKCTLFAQWKIQISFLSISQIFKTWTFNKATGM